jgi:MoxR-like ATPase
MDDAASAASESLGVASNTSDEVRIFFDRVSSEIAKVVVGQEELVTTALIALVSGGHVLIEGVPGLGKTLFVKTLGQVIGCKFGRIQFTADLMPSDVTGAPIFDMKLQDFRFRPGPVFVQLLLADEINRSPAKTHAALLEIMQESRVTIFATQNPLESEGTYSLPEAQLDRFMFKAMVSYPSEEEEARVLEMHSRKVDMARHLETQVQNVSSAQAIQDLIHKVSQVRIEPKLLQYVNRIVRATRTWPTFHIGASPRAGLSLIQGARALAAFRGRDYAVPDDVAEIVLPTLRHRVVLGAEAEVEGLSIDQELRTLLKSIEVPRT